MTGMKCGRGQAIVRTAPGTSLPSQEGRFPWDWLLRYGSDAGIGSPHRSHPGRRRPGENYNSLDKAVIQE